MQLVNAFDQETSDNMTKKQGAPAVVAFAVVAREGVVDALAGAGVLLAALGRARAAEVEGVGEDAQEADQAVQLPHPILRTRHTPSTLLTLRTGACQAVQLPHSDSERVSQETLTLNFQHHNPY